MDGELIPTLIGLAMIAGTVVIAILIAAPNDPGGKKK